MTDDNPLLDAARFGEEDEVRSILQSEAGKDLVQRCHSETGCTALHYAAANGHLDIVKLLITNGSKNFLNKAGNTPLHWAALHGHKEVVTALLEMADTNVLASNEVGRTPLSEAEDKGHQEVAALLLQHPTASSLEKSKVDVE